MAMAARSSLAPLLLLVLPALFSAASAARTVGDAVQDACSKTQFPKVCVDGLTTKPESQKATPRRLAELFMAVTADKGTGFATTVQGKLSSVGEDASSDGDTARNCYDGCTDDLEEAVAHLTAVVEGPTDAKILELKSWLSSTLGGTAVCEDACKGLAKSADKDEVLGYGVDFEKMLRVTLDLVTEASGSMSADIALPPSGAAGAPAPAPSSGDSGSEGPAASAAAPQSGGAASGPAADSPADAPAPSSGDAGSGAPAPSGSSAADGPSGDDAADAPAPASEEDGDDVDSSDDTKA